MSNVYRDGNSIIAPNPVVNDRVCGAEIWIKERLPGISVMHDLATRRDAVYPASYANLLPPVLAELAPPHHPAGRLNPQRVIVEALAERLYADRGWKPANR